MRSLIGVGRKHERDDRCATDRDPLFVLSCDLHAIMSSENKISHRW